MKKVECLITEEKSSIIDEFCEKEGYTRAELLRRIIDLYLDEKILPKQNNVCKS